MLMLIGQRNQHMQKETELEQRRHMLGETELLEGRRQAAVVPGKFDRAATIDLDAILLQPGKNMREADVPAATIVENAVEVGAIAGEMVVVVAAAAAAGLHIERIDSFLKRQAIQEAMIDQQEQKAGQIVLENEMTWEYGQATPRNELDQISCHDFDSDHDSDWSQTSR